MKLIHLSDTHIGTGGNAERLDRVLDDLIRNPPDVPSRCAVLHTGDLIDAALPENREAGKRKLDRLRDAGFRVILCPGNHDYGDFIAVTNEAASAFQREFASYIFHDEQPAFPVLHRLDDGHVLIGLDSNEAELSFLQSLFAEGHLGPRQLEKLNRLLDHDDLTGKKVVLALHHHPFYHGYSVMPDVGDGHLFKHLKARFTRPFRRRKDAYSLCQVARDRVQLVLFGHMHEGLDCTAESRKYGISLGLDGSSTTDTDDNNDRLRYRVVDLESMTHSVKMVMK